MPADRGPDSAQPRPQPRPGPAEQQPSLEQLEDNTPSGPCWRRVHVAGRGFGLVAQRRISAGEVLVREEVPLVAVQDPAGSTVLPACIVCLRPCGTPLEVLRRVLGMVGESDSLAVDGRVAAAEGDDGGAPIAHQLPELLWAAVQSRVQQSVSATLETLCSPGGCASPAACGNHIRLCMAGRAECCGGGCGCRAGFFAACIPRIWSTGAASSSS